MMESRLENTTSGANEGLPDISIVGITDNGRSSAWGIPHGSRAFHASSDASLFSSSLPVLPHEKLKFTDSEDLVQSFDDNLPLPDKLHNEDEDYDQLLESEMNAIGNMLPDDEEELLAGIIDDFDLTRLPSQLEDLDDNDLFGSGGGLEMDYDPQESLGVAFSRVSLSDGVSLNGTGHYALSNGVAPIAGEHPYGEHPSRTLFVRNINSNVEDSELRSLFEQYGDIRTLYTLCKHRGFVMISYYDIRAARTAMRALQNKPLRRRRLDIHFSIPKDNPSEKDINQGTLVVFNLDPSVSNDDLLQIFGAYGEIKEIRETPHKRHHKFIEFYDVRAAEAALKALNRSDIAGKRIKLEPSRPGGTRRNLMHQFGHELDHDELRSFRHHVGSPLTNSPPGNWTRYGSPVEHSPFRSFSNSPGFGGASPTNSNLLPGLASILPHHVSNSAKISPIGKDQGRINHGHQLFPKSLPTQETGFQHSSSYPDQKSNSSTRLLSGFGEPSSGSSSIGTLTGPQFLWGSPTPYSERSSSSVWSTSSGGNPFTSTGQSQGFPYLGRRSSFLGSQFYHHVGSAPSGVALDRNFSCFPESPDTSYTRSVAFGALSHDDENLMINMGSTHAAMGAGVAHRGNIHENSSSNFSMLSLPKHGSLFLGNGLYSGLGGTINDGLIERGWNRRPEINVNQIDIKKQYQLDLDKIIKGEDNRTTLMIKNIPNKYTSKMLLASIDENHRGTYDFLYLPIDFKNKCNVGYAFINMVSPSHIISFYEAFNGKRWEKFNSEKVASLAYARIQGKASLVAHFQNSSLMNEDKRCRPILFHSEGEENGDEESLLSSNLNICIRQPDGSYSGDLLDSPKGDFDEKLDNI